MPALVASAACSVVLLGTVLTACGSSSSGVAVASAAGIEYLSYDHEFDATEDIRFYRFDVRDGCLVVSPVDEQSANVTADMPRNWSSEAVPRWPAVGRSTRMASRFPMVLVPGGVTSCAGLGR